MSDTDTNDQEVEALRCEIKELRATLRDKEQRLLELEAKAEHLDVINENGLSNDDIARYSRQLILPNFGVDGQLKLKSTGFLIVGMGGLGCPAAQYLLAAGCGRIGLVDYDTVERSNFHRQTLHTEARIGMSKVESARIALQEINPKCQIDCHLSMDSSTALNIIASYDIVIDCTDNVPTRYLLNDACVKLGKPLVSGSALQTDGQLTVYNYGETCPCYRCIFPVPPPPDTVMNCGDGGVLGAITGTIGALQALEAIKVAIGLGETLAGRLLIFDGSRCVFRNIKLRGKRVDCLVCSAKPLITDLIDYEQYCGMKASDKDFALNLFEPKERISVSEYSTMQSKPHLLLDVRQPAEFEICKLSQSHNVPLKQLLTDAYLNKFESELQNTDLPVIVLCRRGNDSQIAVRHMREKLPKNTIRDIIGGLHAWHKKIDKDFPIY